MASLHSLARRWLPEPAREALVRGMTLAGIQLQRFPGAEILAPSLRSVLAHYRINCVLDVGANTGGYGRLLRTLGYRGRIVSFEPVRATFEELSRRTARDPQWRALQLALGEREGRVSINVGRDSVFSSLLSPTAFSHEHFGAASEVTGAEEVPLRRLDTVIAECTDGLEEPRVFLKLDTQGYDLHVLDGCGAALSLIHALQSELSVRPLYVGAPSYVDSLNRFRESGYELSGVFPLERDADLAIVEFDCIMVRPGPAHPAPAPSREAR
jgi:FkbM family methyltransferase